MPKPNIAILTPLAPPETAGGVASAHLNIFKGLGKLGARATLLSFNEQGVAVVEPSQARFGAPTWLRALLGFGVYLYLKLSGSRRQAYQLADIIFAIPGILKVNRYLKRCPAEVLVIPDHNAPGLFLSSSAASVILIVHHIPARFNESPLLGNFCPRDVAAATSLEQRVLKKVNAVVCPSEYMKQVFQSTYHFDGEISVIPNLVDEEWIASIPALDVRAELQLPPDVPVVYIPSAGSLFKGAKFVFEIVRRLAGQHQGPLAFYLSGQVEADLAAELEHAPGNARLFMPGRVSHEINIAYVKSCSFGVSPTLIESFGMALLEAGFCAVPMVVFDVGGTNEVVRDGENGYLVPLLDMETLVERAASLLDAQHCLLFKQATRQSVMDRFDANRIARELLSLCERYSNKCD